MHRLGVRIRLFGRSGSIKPLSDMAIRDYAEKVFKSEFFLDTKANLLGLERVVNKVKISFVDHEDGIEKAEKFALYPTTDGDYLTYEELEKTLNKSRKKTSKE